MTTTQKIYLSSGSGIAASGEHGEGLMMSQALSNTDTLTENGRSKTDSFSVNISVSFMFVPESNAAFLVVETKKRDGAGVVNISRPICNGDVESFDAFYTRSDSVCVKQWTQIDWPKPGK